ncbi:MAG: trigger factor [Bacteroidales bacterium]|nr:trigger factor [Bacteroidales bacterium]MBO7623092.1 trigger factor [Bacteroidales bacterium]MBP5741421.1 trigger factor [Bacteroidales bacterium]MBR6363318.1 trigger factor [Bacteroidales bacterium]SKC53046.1 trigger factor [Bacteroidales bacterium WCE2008]
MNIVKNQVDDLNLQITVNIAADDYAAAEKKKLNEVRRRADFKGFRKGMVPMTLVQKVYGEQVLGESVNEVLSDAINNFIKENKLNVVGEPLPSEDQPELEWKSGNDFSFKFDIATTPEVKLDVTKDDKIPYYSINVTKEAKNEMKENMLKQVGSLQDGKKAGEDDFVIADLSNGEINVEGAYIAVRNVMGDAHAKFVGAKAGDIIDVDVNVAFENETDRASMLKIKKEELAGINPAFQATVKNIKTYVDAEENQETYDKLFGEDKVHNTEEFDAAVEERLAANYKQEADYRLGKDIRDYLVEKANIALPESFLKRWLFKVNEGKFTMEEIEKEFDSFLADFRWQMVRGTIMQKNGLKVDEKDIREAAEGFVAYQYAMYGLGNVPQEMIQEAAKNVLKDENQVRRLEESVEEQKVVAAVKEVVTLQTKKISVEKFRELK